MKRDPGKQGAIAAHFHGRFEAGGSGKVSEIIHGKSPTHRTGLCNPHARKVTSSDTFAFLPFNLM